MQWVTYSDNLDLQPYLTTYRPRQEKKKKEEQDKRSTEHE